MPQKYLSLQPNVVMKLRDGNYTDKLVYRYRDFKTGKSKGGALRGVCACENGKKGAKSMCHPDDKQVTGTGDAPQ